MGEVRPTWAEWLMPDEQAVLRHLTERRLAVSPPNAWGTHRVLTALAGYGLASKCGRLFHATGPGDRVCATLPPMQTDLFGAAA